LPVLGIERRFVGHQARSLRRSAGSKQVTVQGRTVDKLQSTAYSSPDIVDAMKFVY